MAEKTTKKPGKDSGTKLRQGTGAHTDRPSKKKAVEAKAGSGGKTKSAVAAKKTAKNSGTKSNKGNSGKKGSTKKKGKIAARAAAGSSKTTKSPPPKPRGRKPAAITAGRRKKARRDPSPDASSTRSRDSDSGSRLSQSIIKGASFLFFLFYTSCDNTRAKVICACFHTSHFT